MSNENTLIPPAALILDNKIGTNDREKVQEEFAELGERMAKGLVSTGRLEPSSNILDVGCGLGRVASGFTKYIRDGSYTGIDIVKTSVDWCQKSYAHIPNFQFIHADLYSKFYNPDSSIPAEQYKFPLESNSYDFVFSMSLFTHLLQDAAENYIKEISRVLKPGKRTFNTFFFVDEETESLTRNSLPHEVPGGRVQSLDAPEAVSALYLKDLEDMHRRNGLDIIQIGYGNWSGRKGAAGGYQDSIVAVKI